MVPVATVATAGAAMGVVSSAGSLALHLIRRMRWRKKAERLLPNWVLKKD